MNHTKIGIYIYDDAEVLDFSGPFEVFSTASRVCKNEDPFEVFLIGETGENIHARGGYEVCPKYGFRDDPELDILIVVGGVHDGEMSKPQVIKWITQKAEQASLVASVCTGAFLLAKAGVLTTENVTTHWADLDALEAQFPDLTVTREVRWVDAGTRVTSGGISAGIDMSLHLVSRLHSEALAQETAKRMEFSRTENGIS